MRVLLTGASGFVGRQLGARLVAAGHRVLSVGRGAGADCDWSEASLERGVAASDAIVHLAGENLFARRWSAAFKAELVRSRVETTARLAELAARHGSRAFVCASAIGYYGASEQIDLDEGAARGAGFLADLCGRWEAAAEPARRAGVRTASVRIGLVLGRGGGALVRLVPLFRWGLGGRAGSGRQWVSWIHIEDLCALFQWILEQESARGVYNGTAPEPVTNAELARALGRALHRPALLPAPAFALRLALGEAAEALLDGQHVAPAHALAEGFAFRYTALDGALSACT